MMVQTENISTLNILLDSDSVSGALWGGEGGWDSAVPSNVLAWEE